MTIEQIKDAAKEICADPERRSAISELADLIARLCEHVGELELESDEGADRIDDHG